MSQTQSPSDWRELFRQAVRGWNSDARTARLQRAFEAVRCRLREESDSGSLERGEREELDDAAYFLGLLSRVVQMDADRSFGEPRTGTDGPWSR